MDPRQTSTDTKTQEVGLTDKTSLASSLSEKYDGQSSPPPAGDASVSTPRAASPTTDFQPSTRLYLAFLALCTLTLMVALDSTSISVALPIISSRLHGSALEAFWAGTGFLLASTVFQPSFASFSHIFGRVPLVITAILLFFVGTMVAGFANDFAQLLAGRCVQGVGGGGVIAMTEVVITDLVPLRYRPQWASLIGAMWAVGSVSGPVIGGAFSQQVSWRWIFWINLPFIGVGSIMILLFLRLKLIPGSVIDKLKRVDWVGSVMFVGSATAVLIPLTWGGVSYDWQSWRTLVPLIVGVVGLVAFGLFEVYVAPEPLVRLAVFRNRSTNIGYVTTVFHGLILWCLLYYQPLWFETVKELSPILSGVALFPASFTVAPMGIVTGVAISKLGRYRWFVILGWAITVLGLGILVLLDVDTRTVQWIFIDLVSGIGLGVLFPALQIQIQAASTTKDMAFAVAIFSFFRAFGQSLGVAIGGVIFQNQMVRNLRKYPQFAAQAPALAKDAAALVEVVKRMTDADDRLALKTAYTQSIRTIYIALCAIAGVGLVISWFIREYDLTAELETEQGLVTGEKDSAVRIEDGR